MRIEAIQPEDIPMVKNLLSETWKATYGKDYPPEVIEKITSDWHAPEKLLAQSRDKNIYFAAAKVDRVIAGIITVRRNADNSLFMSRIYVDPRYQGQRIGTKLMESAFAYFPGATVMRLECEKQNTAACGFYLKQGFRKIKEKEETIKGITMKTVEYEKQLQKNA